MQQRQLLKLALISTENIPEYFLIVILLIGSMKYLNDKIVSEQIKCLKRNIHCWNQCDKNSLIDLYSCDLKIESFFICRCLGEKLTLCLHKIGQMSHVIFSYVINNLDKYYYFDDLCFWFLYFRWDTSDFRVDLKLRRYSNFSIFDFQKLKRKLLFK